MEGNGYVKILLASPIDPATIESLETSYDVRHAVNAEPPLLAEAISDRDTVILRSGVQLSAEVLGQAPDMKLIVRAGSGLDNIDVGYARERGIRVDPGTLVCPRSRSPSSRSRCCSHWLAR
jgi:D-3-phosphoglycerate dehydrogenase